MSNIEFNWNKLNNEMRAIYKELEEYELTEII